MSSSRWAGLSSAHWDRLLRASCSAAKKEVDDRQQRNQPINTTCPVADKPIDPQHTVEHDGRRIAFCCGKCKAAFVAEPAKFLAKLPPK
jgi:YHS domain-containing protein